VGGASYRPMLEQCMSVIDEIVATRSLYELTETIYSVQCCQSVRSDKSLC